MIHNKSLASWARPFFITSIMAVAFNNLWNHSLIWGDSYRDMGPQKFLLAQGLKKAIIYGWYPWQRMGLPFIGDVQAGYFYPFNLVYLAFSFALAHRLFIFLHYPLAAIFMDMFLRRRGLDRYSSLVGGLVFALSGYMVGLHKTAFFMMGPAWAPLAIYFMDRALSGSILWALGVAAVFTMQICAGDPQNAYITAIPVALMGITVAFNPSRRKASIGALGLAYSVFVLICAAQLLPTFELMHLSTRATGLPLDDCTYFSFHPGLLIELVWPMPFGRLWPDGFYWAGFTFKNMLGPIPWTISNYIGLPALVLAIVGIIFSGRRWKIWVGAGAIIFLLISFGRYTPIYALLFRVVPLFDSFRYPAKYMAWFSGFTAVAAALGMEHVLVLLGKKVGAMNKAAVSYISSIVFGAVLAIIIWPRVISYVTGLTPRDDNFQLIKSYLFGTGIQWLLINLAVGAILLLVSIKIIPIRLGKAAFIFILVTDYYLTNMSAMPVGPPDIYNYPRVAAEAINPGGAPPLGRYRILALESGGAFYGLNPAFKKYGIFEKYAIWQYESMNNDLHAMEGFEDIYGYDAIHFKDWEDVFIENRFAKMLELYNVKYVVSLYNEKRPREVEGIMTEALFADPQNELMITLLPEAWPRAYWVPGASIASKDNDAVKMLDSVDLRKTVIVTTRENMPEQGPVEREMKPASLISYQPDRVAIECEAGSSGWLVLSDRYYPGWGAFDNGAPVKIHKANVFVRAIPLKPGKHTVDFIYHPVTLRIGMMVSLVSWMVMAALAIIVRRNKLPAGK